MYIRKKHGGAEEAVCDVTLPLVVHGMLKEAYRRFVFRNNKKVASSDDAGEQLPALTNGDPLLPHSFGDPVELPVKFEFDRAAWAAQNDRFRSKSSAFLSQVSPRPVAECICLRMVVATVQCMEKEEFWIGSKKWNIIEDAKAAKANTDGDEFRLLRDYQALVHARGQVEDKGLRKMRMLFFDVRLWGFLPDQDLTNELKVMAFCGLTSAEGSTYRHFCAPRRQVSIRMLLILEQPDLIPAILDVPACLHTGWSWDFISKNDLTTVAAKMKLLLHVILLHENTNNLEVQNAQLRLYNYGIL